MKGWRRSASFQGSIPKSEPRGAQLELIRSVSRNTQTQDHCLLLAGKSPAAKWWASIENILRTVHKDTYICIYIYMYTYIKICLCIYPYRCMCTYRCVEHPLCTRSRHSPQAEAFWRSAGRLDQSSTREGSCLYWVAVKRYVHIYTHRKLPKTEIYP